MSVIEFAPPANHAAQPAASAAGPWLEHYPPGVGATVDIPTHLTVVDILEDSMRRHAHRTASRCLERTMSFGQMDQLSQTLGAWLQSKGLQHGDRVAIMMPNVPQYMVAIAGILRAGFAVVNVNPLYTARELEHQLKDSGAKAIIVLENFASTLEEAIDKTDVQHVVVTGLGDLIGWWKGRFVNFAVRHLRKMVPEYRLPLDSGRTVTRWRQMMEEGRSRTLQRPQREKP